ncbi:DUF169 domain-containing protein [Candidatus Omnitrophota bacterium]
MELVKWEEYSRVLKEVFGLEHNPVAVNCLKDKDIDVGQGKVRICRAILDAATGKSLKVDKANNACFGASWHLGFSQIKDPQVIKMIKKFVVEGEKLFCSYEALDKLISQMEDNPDNSGSCFVLSPLSDIEHEPELVIFVCNPEQACRLLTFVTFFDGLMPKIKIGGPTCRMAIMYPLLTGEVNISFQDATARKMCNMDKNLLFVSIPAKRIPQIVENFDKCSAGTAKMEFPPEFRKFLQQRLAKN